MSRRNLARIVRAAPVPVGMRLAVEEQVARRKHPLRGARIDPFRTYWVDPRRINLMSGRARPREGASVAFGMIREGDWDRQAPVAHDGDGIARLVTDRWFNQTVHHQSLEAHFKHGIPWEQTEFFQYLIELGGDTRWPKYSSPERIRHATRQLDALYADLKFRGVLSNRQMAVEENRNDSFYNVLRHEIIVDVGRFGDLLFYEGRHRLSVAKIAGLSRVPIVVSNWHPDGLQSSLTAG